MAQFSRLDVFTIMLEPCPWTRIIPTGGMQATRESIAIWLKAGASCAGMGSQLLRDSFISSNDFDGLTSLAQDVLGWIREARSER